MNSTKARNKMPAAGTKIVVGGNTVRIGLAKAPKTQGKGTGK